MKKVYLSVAVFIVWLSGAALAGNPSLEVEINIPECTLRVYVAEQVLYQAPVGIGRPGHESPVGEFTIINKIVNPTWYPKDKEPVPPGPTNPLGSYWLGLSISGYGIHGNISPWSIGTPVSSGCIRMHNDDIELMYRLIDRGTRVRIRYQTITLAGEGADLQICILPDVYNYGTSNIFKFIELVDATMQEAIFIPRVISLLDTEPIGVFPVPWKVTVQYGEQIFPNIGYEEGGIVYLDPRFMKELVKCEEELAVFLQLCEGQYLTIPEIESQLRYHQVQREGRMIWFSRF